MNRYYIPECIWRIAHRCYKKEVLLEFARDKGEGDVILDSIQPIAGRTGQESTQRKKRKGAYWEDRYHPTAVKTNNHLIQCLLQVGLDTVRAGVLGHPSEWPFSSHNEIRQPRKQYLREDLHHHHLQ